MRKYFTRLFGNDDTRQRTGRAIAGGRAPHAFLIDGPEGSGKATLATEIASALNCAAIKDTSRPLPCGACSSCKRILAGNFPDLKILERPKDKATLGVEAVKLFREDMFLSSTESDHKIYVIKNAESMTAEAQNALLKVLEEPPRGVVIILLADGCDRILTTIKSRTQYIAMTRFTESELRAHLLSGSDEARRIESEAPDRLTGIIMSADGRLGRALQLVNPKFAKENEEKRGEVLDFLSAIAAHSGFRDIHAAVSALPQKRTELILSLERIISALRDLIIIKECPGAPTVFFPTSEEAMRAAADVPLKRLLAVYDALRDTHALCIKNANVAGLATSLIAKIKIGLGR